MLDPALRPLKDRLLLPLAGPVGRVASPGALTVLSLLVGLGSAGLLLLPEYGLALVAWLFSRVLDGLDGTVARAHARQTDFGGYIDIICDFVVYAAVPISLALGRGPTLAGLTALSFLLASFYLNAASWMYLAAILEKRTADPIARREQTTVAMPDAVIGGSETIIFFSVFILLPQLHVPLFALMAALVMLNVLLRLVWARRVL